LSFANGTLTDKWKVCDFGEEKIHLNSEMYEEFIKNARSLEGKEFERFDKTEEFVSAVNNKSFQKLN
jgi:hypothetical protein